MFEIVKTVSFPAGEDPRKDLDGCLAKVGA
jgi:hypothetical protein